MSQCEREAHQMATEEKRNQREYIIQKFVYAIQVNVD